MEVNFDKRDLIETMARRLGFQVNLSERVILVKVKDKCKIVAFFTVEFGFNTPPLLNTPLVKSDFQKVFFQIFKMRLIIRFLEKRLKYPPWLSAKKKRRGVFKTNKTVILQ